MKKYIKIALIALLLGGFWLFHQYKRPLWAFFKATTRATAHKVKNVTRKAVIDSFDLREIYQKDSDPGQNNQQTKKSGQIKVTSTLGNTKISKTDKSMFLMLTLAGLDLPTDLPERRPDLNIAFVIDRSGSMSGQKLDDVKQALVDVSDLLSAQDKVSLVVYDDRVNTAYEPAYFERQQFLQAVNQIRSGGSTYLEGGLRQGLKHVSDNPETNRINRVILLSDGLANVGVDDPYRLGRIVKDLAGNKAAVSTIGVGADFDEILMTEVAKSGKGNYYFLEGSEQAGRIFAQEFERATSVVAQEVKIKFKLNRGVKLVDSFGYEMKAGQIEPQDIISGQSNNYLFKLELDPTLVSMASNNQEIDLGKVVLSYHESEPVEFDLTAQVIEAEVNPLADDSVYQEYIETYQAQRELEIYQDLEQVNNQAAKDKNLVLIQELKKAATRLPGIFDQKLKELDEDQDYIESLGESDVKSSYKGKIFQKERQNSSVDKLNNK